MEDSTGNVGGAGLLSYMRTNSAQAVPENRNNSAPDRQGLLREFVDRLPLMPPVEMAAELERSGYKGQHRQKAALSLMAYRHIRRLKRLYVEGVPRETLPPKQNVLIAGPTGCGKTYLVELLFERLLGVPTIILDTTNFTERGYVGDDVSTILTRLIETARGNATLAVCGVVCLDEFDKLASSSSNARFAGQGTTKDVSGYGVQRELLSLIDGADVSVPMDYGFSGHGPRLQLSTRDMPFIACGAFSGLDLSRRQSSRQIGFGTQADCGDDPGALPEVAMFQRYGFMPELIGRFTQTLCFSALDRETLGTILLDNVLPRFQNEFLAEGIELRTTDEAIRHIVDQTATRGTGARGLQTELVGIVENAAYETFMCQKNVVLTITSANGKLTCGSSQAISGRRHMKPKTEL
jgi:ATP-dependent Clp protease ATP-binding subunit ClpX